MNKSLLLAWWALLLLTGLSYFIGEQPELFFKLVFFDREFFDRSQYNFGWVIILGLAGVKAQLLSDYLMGLKPVGGVWRMLLATYGWLILTILGLLIWWLK